MTAPDAEKLHLRLQINLLEQELVRLRQGLSSRGIKATDYGSNSVTAALLTIDLYRNTAEELAKEFRRLRICMSDRGLALQPDPVVDQVLKYFDETRRQLDECGQRQTGVWGKPRRTW